jgi:hypothetical protein
VLLVHLLVTIEQTRFPSSDSPQIRSEFAIQIDQIDQSMSITLTHPILNQKEILTGQSLLKVKREPKSRIQQLQTVTVALDCLDAIGIRTQGISSFEIVEGNLKIALGLMWSLVSYFQIQEGGKRSNLAGKRALLVWVKNQVKQFDLPVNNFGVNFRDGKVLCALVDALHPGEINMKAVMSGANERKNIERALDLAETSLDIPRILEPDDLLAAKPDEMSIMTYVSFFRLKWSKPLLDDAAVAEQRAHLTVRPQRDAPTGTIRRLMEEIDSGAAQAPPAAPAPQSVAPVVVPDSMADEDSADEDSDAEAIDAIMNELERPDPVVADEPPAAPAPVASPPRATRNPNALSQSAALPAPRAALSPAPPPAAAPAPLTGSLRRVPPAAASLVANALRHNDAPPSSPPAAAVGSLRRAPPAADVVSPRDASPAAEPLASPRSSAGAEPSPGSLRRQAPAPSLRASAPAEPAAPAGALNTSGSLRRQAPQARATPPAEPPAPSEPLDDEIDSLLAEGDAEILRRAAALAPKAAEAPKAAPAASDLDALLAEGEATIQRRARANATPGAAPAKATIAAAASPSAGAKAPTKLADLDALMADADALMTKAPEKPAEKERERPKVCEICQTRKVAAKITPKGGAAQFVCKPCALEAKERADTGPPAAAVPAAVPAAATAPKAATAARAGAAAAPVAVGKNPSPLSASGRQVRKVPNFVGKPGDVTAAAAASAARAPQRSTTIATNLASQVKPVASAAQFETSSLRVGKKAAGDVKSRRHFRHSVIVQVPARPDAALPAPTPDGPGQSDAERLKDRRLDRTKTRESLAAAELMAQMEALLAEEGFGFGGAAASGDDVPPAPDDGPPAELVEANEANQSANVRQLATLQSMWFYSDVTREAAEDLLAAEDAGAFVVRPSGAERSLALTFKASNGQIQDDALVLDGKLWRYASAPAGGGVASAEEALRGDARLAFERTRTRRQQSLLAAARDEEDDGSGEDMEISSRESLIMAPGASLRGALPSAATGGTLSRSAAKAAADAAAATLGMKFSLDAPLAAPGAGATPQEKERWTVYCDWLAAQNITLEEYAMRVHHTTRDEAARLASEVTLRTVATAGTDEAAEEGLAEKGEVRAELGDGAREIEIELADMATFVAIADYQSENDNELSFKEGQHVIVLGPDDSGWWKAELNGQFGWVPAAFFERVRDTKAQVAPDVINEVELASAELAAVAAAQAAAKPAPTSLADSGDASSSKVAKADAAPAVAAAAAAAAEAAAAAADREPTLAEDGEVMYTQAIEDFLAESEGELAFRRDDYVCALKPDAGDASGWWKGQLPTGEFGWVPAEFLEVLPAKPKDWANRVPLSKARATVKVEAALQSNVGNEIREMEACEARWGGVAAKFGKLWTKDASPTNVVTGGASESEWRQRFCVLLKKERRLLELKSWQDEPAAALASHHVSTSLSSTHAARSFAFFVRTRKTAVLLAPIAADKEARIERDEWLAAIASVTKETLKAKRSGGSSGAAAAASSRTKSRSRAGSSAAGAAAGAAAAAAEALLQGKLQKKSFGWSSRWFAVSPSGRLQWWNSATDAQSGKPAKTAISLAGAQVGKPPNAGRHHAFFVKTAAESLMLRAKSAEEADKWIATIGAVVSK